MLAVQVPRSQLERRLAYRQIATVELIGQLAFYAIALPAAFLGMGVWAPVAGLWGQQLLSWLLLSIAARFRPGLHWEGQRAMAMMREGFQFTVASWLWQARSLVNPLIVGHFLGATGVAFVDLTVRFADNLSFIRSTASRISLPILSQLQLEAARLVRTIEEGTRWQMLPLGVGFVGFVWLSPFAVPLVFGSDWSPVLTLLPFVAFGYLTNTLFTLQVSGLFVLRRYLDVAAVHLVHVVLFALTAAVLVPRVGLVGYGYGEIAATAAYVLLHLLFSRAVQRPDYRVAGGWWIAFGAACFAQPIGWWMAIPLLILLISPGFWRQVRALLRQWSVAWARPAAGSG
jgi:PST family polysaccharide transporter